MVHEVFHTKTSLSMIERVGDIFVYYTAVPIMDGEQLIGEVLIGLQLSNKVLKNIAKGSNIELAIVGDRALGASSLQDENNQSIVLLPIDYAQYQWLLSGKIDLLSVKIANNEYYIKAKELQLIDQDATNASLMMMHNKKNYLEQLKQIKIMQTSILLILVVSLLFAVVILSLYLKRNFSKLFYGLKQISQGKYGHQIVIDSNDELKTLAEYFNEMSYTIKHKDDSIKVHMQSLEETVLVRTQELNSKNLFLQKLLDLQDAMILVIENERVSFINRSYLNFCGCKEEKGCVNPKTLDLTSKEVVLKDREGLERVFNVEKVFLGKQSIMLMYYDITVLKEKERTLYEKATRDFLTKLYSREKFEEMFEFMITSANRNNKEIVLALLDIDFFKKVNDTYGHLVGDSVLKTLADFLRTNLRKNDMVGRWGGEEFILAIEVNEVSEAKDILEKLRVDIESFSFEQVGHITCSFGMTHIGLNQNREEAFKIADKALYSAKENGRNRIVFFA
jgi:diguanylate cyclase (GGDEF)-like protein